MPPDRAAAIIRRAKTSDLQASSQSWRFWRLTAADFITVNEKRVMIGLEPIAEPQATERVEVKFNPWHDPKDGRFTFRQGGSISGAREFGGPDKDFNHFAQDGDFNRRGYRKLERDWGKMTQAGKKVTFAIIPQYPRGSRRPSAINVTYFDGKDIHVENIPNGRGR